MSAVIQIMFTLLLLTVISLTNSQPPYGQNRYQPPPQYIPPRPRLPPRRQPPTHLAPSPPQQPPAQQPTVHRPTAHRPPPPQTPVAHAPVLQTPIGHPPLQRGTMGPVGLGVRKKLTTKQCMDSWCAFRRMEISPRCGYDGEIHRNECMVQCRQTYEACSGTCPCYEGISSPPDHVFVVPNPRVFPRSIRSKKGGKTRKVRRRPKGRRPNCNCFLETFDPVCTPQGTQLNNACEAYCTYNEILCDQACPCPPRFQFGAAMPGASPAGSFAG